MGGKESTFGSPVKHMLARHGLSRHAEPVRLALTLAGAAESRGADGGSSRRSALTSSGLLQVSEMLPEKTAKSPQCWGYAESL